MSAATIVRTGESLEAIVRGLFEGSGTATGLKSRLHRSALTEKDAQDATAAGVSPQKDAEADAVDQGPSKTVQADSDVDSLKSGQVTHEQIIEKLNSIRSGKSFRDENVERSMQEYVESLKTPERTALLAFLKGIAQIVTGEVGGSQAVDPADPEPSVKMKKGNGDQNNDAERKTLKPNVIKKQSSSGQKKSSIEDTSAPVPVPIKPKK